MILALLIGSTVLNVLQLVVIAALMDKRRDDEAVSPRLEQWRDNLARKDREDPESSRPKQAPKPFRARKSFREARKQFEDAHDPQRMSRARVEKFAQAKE